MRILTPVCLILLWCSIATGHGTGGVIPEGAYPNHAEKKEELLKEATDKLDDKEPFGFDDIWNSTFRARGFDGKWICDTSIFSYRKEDGSVYLYNAETDIDTKFVDKDIFSQVGGTTYFVAEDQEYVLIAYSRERVWRHSFTAIYKIYQAASGELIDFPSGDLGGKRLQYARWGSKGNSLAFVYGNNLFYQASPTSSPVQLTTNGEPESRFNGIPDWVYEEDVLTVAEAHYWSPDAKKIVYASFDASEVPRQKWPQYGDKTNVFPNVVEIAYPKAGDIRDGKLGPNTEVELFLVDTEQLSSGSKIIAAPQELQNEDLYYTRVTWRDTESFFINWVNRVQNRTVQVICNTQNSPISCAKHQDYSQENGWIDSPYPKPLFFSDPNTYATVRQNSDTTELKRQLTLIESPVDREGRVTLQYDGDEVVSVAGYDDELKLLYYISTGGNPSERHIYRVGLPSSEPEYRPPVCLTCSLGDDCKYFTASFSSDGKHYMRGCRGPGVPSYTLVSVNKEREVVMEANNLLRAAISKKELPRRDFMEIDILGNYKGYAEMFYPPDFNPEKKYPLLVYTYAGPNSQRVVKTFPMGSTISNWLRFLSSSLDVVVASVDGRGTLARGDKFLFEIYRKLGETEVQDQIQAGREFQKMPFINNDLRSAIFGWSYGGHTSSHVIGDTTDVFTCGIAVAPVSAKTYYDTAYTERYLAFATEDDNAAGYDREDVMNKAANFAGKKYLIAHGTADDNVHFMHMTQMIQALVDADVQFRQLVYPDADHYINSPKSSKHLFTAMTSFLLDDCWEGKV